MSRGPAVFDKLERSELLRLMQFSDDCLTATLPAHLQTIISSIYDFVGYRKAALCELSPLESQIAVVHSINHSYGAQWADLYVRREYQSVDPILVHSRATEGAFHWDEIGSSSRREGTTELLEAAEAFGIAGGITFSCAGVSAPFRSVLSLTNVPPEEIERTRRILAFIGPHLHEAYRRVRHFQPHPEIVVAPSARGRAEPSARGRAEPVELAHLRPGARVELSAREREILCWAQQGKTYWEIGSILSISQRTVKFHVARIKAKLDVVSTAHAIAKAMRAGILT